MPNVTGFILDTAVEKYDYNALANLPGTPGSSLTIEALLNRYILTAQLMQQGGCRDLVVNGVPLDTYGGATLLDYTIGETALKTETFQGINRTNWTLLRAMFEQREVSLTIIFRGPNLHEAKKQRSVFNSAIFGRSVLYLPDDGFFYTVSCTSFGAEVLVGQGDQTAQIQSEYHFRGIRHDELRTETITSGAPLQCLSTMPFTDCALTATVGTSAESYQLGGAVFQDVTAGDVLVFDGINGMITRNGLPDAANVSWASFPSLTPGENLITCPDTVTVTYFPTYI